MNFFVTVTKMVMLDVEFKRESSNILTMRFLFFSVLMSLGVGLGFQASWSSAQTLSQKSKKATHPLSPSAKTSSPKNAAPSAGKKASATKTPTIAEAASNPSLTIDPAQIRRNEYIMLRKLPHSEKALLKIFGERPKREERHIQNHHDQSMDTVIKLIFTNANMDLYANKKNPDSVNFLGMTLEEQKRRLESYLPIQVDHSREDFEKTFEVDTEGQEYFEMCELQEVTIAGPIYSSSCVVFSFAEDKIKKIDWVLPLD